MLDVMPSFIGNTENQNLFSRDSYSHWADKVVTEMAMIGCKI